MILETAAIVAAFGMILFVAGMATDNPGVAMVGAIFIIGVGGAGTLDGLQQKTGEVESFNNTTNETVVHNTYEDVQGPEDFPIGIMVVLSGFVLLIGAAGEASES